MSLHQKIIKRGEEKAIVSNSQLQNTSATDNYQKDDQDLYDGENYQDQDQDYDEDNNDSYEYNENNLGEILNDSDDNQNQNIRQQQQQQNIQQQRNNMQKTVNSQQQQQINKPVQDQRQYYNHVIKSQSQQVSRKAEQEYDLSDSEEDERQNQQADHDFVNQYDQHNDDDVHYSQIEREIYGISKEQEERERQERQRKRREEEEAKLRHQQLLQESKYKEKKKDSRDYNCSTECIQSSSGYFPISKKIANDIRMPLAISVAPFYEPECLDVVNFKRKKNQQFTTPYMNEEDIPRCTQCYAIINPFCEILESLCKWKCNMCFNIQAVPKVYKDSIYNIRQVRTELQYGSYDILLPNKYKVKRESEFIYWFMIDVSRESVQNGFLRTTCEGIRNALQSQGIQTNKNNIQIGLVGYDDELHLFNISKRLRSPQIYIYKDLETDMDKINEDTVYHLNEQSEESEQLNQKGIFSMIAEKITFKKTPVKEAKEPKFQKLEYEYPFPDDIIQNFGECEKHVFTLLDQIEIMYEDKYKKEDEVKENPLDNKQGQPQQQKKLSIFYKALEFSLDHIKFTGGKFFIFHANPNLLQSQNKKYTLYSILNKFEDTFISPSFFYQQGSLTRDLISFIYKVIKESNGDIQDISPTDILNKKYLSDLTESISQKYCWESVLRFRCSSGWSVSTVQGNTQIRNNTYNLLNLNCDTNVQVEMSITKQHFFINQLFILTNINYLSFKEDFPNGQDTALNQMISYQRMGPSELDTQFVPLLFDYQEIRNSNVYDDQGAYIFPKSLSLSYQNIFDKELIVADFGKEFIIFIIAANVQPQTLKLVFNTENLDEIRSKTKVIHIYQNAHLLIFQQLKKDQFYKNTSQDAEKIMILLNSLQTQIKFINQLIYYLQNYHLTKISLKSRSHISFKIVITDEGNPKEYEFYYKLIEDKYDSFQRGYSKSYEEFLDQLLKQIN